MAGERELYPSISPYDHGSLKVSDVHVIYYEQCGNRNGNSVLSIHGGPASAGNTGHRQYFDPEAYRIILFDQRGCGRSTPSGELRENTTWDTVRDIERLREHLGIEKWVVVGGGWGSALVLLYAETYTDRVKALVVWAVMTLRRRELCWLFQDGVGRIFPDAWEGYVNHIPQDEREDLITAYHRRLTSDDEDTRASAASCYGDYQNRLYRLLPDDPPPVGRHIRVQHGAAIASHYVVNGGFLNNDNHIIDNIEKIRNTPCVIIQSRYDMVCPMETAWTMHKRWPEAEFLLIQNAGHSRRDAPVTTAVLNATDKFKTL